MSRYTSKQANRDAADNIAEQLAEAMSHHEGHGSFPMESAPVTNIVRKGANSKSPTLKGWQNRKHGYQKHKPQLHNLVSYDHLPQ